METFIVTNHETGTLIISGAGWFVVAQLWEPAPLGMALVGQELVARYPDSPEGFAAAVDLMRDLRKHGRAVVKVPAQAAPYQAADPTPAPPEGNLTAAKWLGYLDSIAAWVVGPVDPAGG